MARHLKVLTITFLLGASLTAGAVSASAQVVPTGTLSGRVVDQNGAVINGASVSIESPNLQGVESKTTTLNGDYSFQLLPPGQYTVTVKVRGFADTKRTITLSATEARTLEITVRPAAVSEDVTVRADGSSFFMNTVQSSTNLKASTISLLPTGRTLLSAVDLAPAVHSSGPSGARTMSGAMSFENSFMINGVQIQDNLRGTPFSLFIEDAIQETTTTTSGISAEYGRFMGGVVNAITKSGSNVFSGSLRTTLTNDNWRTVTPAGEPKADKLVPAYEVTAGGAAVRNRTWLFGALRTENKTTGRQTGEPHVPYNFESNEQRYEGKITQSLGTGHRLEASFMAVERKDVNDAYPSEAEVIDLNSLKNRELPQRLGAVHYTGAVTQNFFVEAQYSQRTFKFVNDGGLNTDLILGTPLIDNNTNEWWHAPSFCGVCIGEQRNNNNLVLKGSLFQSTSMGSHNMTFGYDLFNDIQKGDNHQSATDFHVYTSDHLIRDGVIYPVMAPLPSFSSFVVYWPITESSKGTAFKTHSLFFNDSWAANRHVTLNLGVRFDKNHGLDHGHNLVADDKMLSPRLGVVFDPKGDGSWTINAGYSRYVAALAGSVAEGASPAGTPSILAYVYDGPSINTNPNNPLVSSDDALKTIFAWYDSLGIHRQDYLVQATIPGVGVKIPKSLKSPHADEITFGIARALGSRGSVRFDVVHRKFSDFYADRIDTTTGQAEDEFGQVFDVQFVENSNVPQRKYDAFNAQGTFRPLDRLDIGVSYSLSKLQGNINGENVGSGPISSQVLLYPEYRDLTWFAPVGPLSADQRHRAKAWWVWSMPLGGDANMLSVSMIQTMQSGTPYGAVGSVKLFDEQGPFVQDPGYAVTPDTNPYFFTPRDEFHTAAMYRSDFSVNFERQLGSTRPARLFVQLYLFNAFNQFAAFDNSANSIDTTVLTANDDPDRFQTFNPFVETPVRGTHWDLDENFGKPRNSTAYTMPRTFRMSVGLKF